MGKDLSAALAFATFKHVVKVCKESNCNSCIFKENGCHDSDYTPYKAKDD